MKRPSHHNLFALTLALGFLSVASTAQADWVSGAVGSWSDSTKWDGGNIADSFAELARLGSNGYAGGEEATIDSGYNAIADRFIIGQNSANPTFVSTVIIDSGSLTTDSGTVHRIGQTSKGVLTVNGGQLNVQNAGYSSDNGGTLNVNGGDIDFGGGSTVGTGSTGAINVNGSTATFDMAGGLTIGAFGSVNFATDNTLAGVTSLDNTGLLTLNAVSVLTIDLAPYDPVNAGADLILFDYGTLSGTFGTVNIINGTGTLDYAYDQGGGDLAIALTNVIPTPAALPAGLALIGALAARRRR